MSMSILGEQSQNLRGVAFLTPSHLLGQSCLSPFVFIASIGVGVVLVFAASSGRPLFPCLRGAHPS